ncbi:tyrosine-type recombinase/integrase [Ponticoccus litoralis]|uniref:Tyrosine-type recombinase/integrase n=1 Tax=Ponticoccus litoralis TaxID=422297 RepID=A0AAW9SPF0_9RHOB
MATIRKLSSGKYRIEIVKRQGPGKKPLRLSRNFSRRSEATAWADEVEKRLNAPGGVERYQERQRHGSPTVGDLVARYVRDADVVYGPTKKDYLRKLQKFEFASRIAEDLESADWTEFARDLRLEGRHPSTVAGYYGTLAEVMKLARAAWGVRVDVGAITDGRFAANSLGYTGKSSKRSRRPTLDELDLLMRFSIDAHDETSTRVPLHFLIAFAVMSGRRQAEICQLRHEDITQATIVVRDMKSPKGSRGNHKSLWLLPQALRVSAAHDRACGRDPDRLFPYHPDTVSRRFTEAVKATGIKDLHFHDLRHEALSWLGETGWTAHQIMRVSGHATSQILDRYMQLEAPGDKFDQWEWLEILENLEPRS